MCLKAYSNNLLEYLRKYDKKIKNTLYMFTERERYVILYI